MCRMTLRTKFATWNMQFAFHPLILMHFTAQNKHTRQTNVSANCALKMLLGNLAHEFLFTTE